MTSIGRQVRHFIVDDLGWEGSPDELTDHLPLIERRVLDSIRIMALVAFLEEEFGIRVEDHEMVPGHLGTLAGIEDYVARKQRQD